MLKRLPFYLAIMAFGLFGLSSCDFSEAPVSGEVDLRGKLIEFEVLEDWSTDEINDLIADLDPLLFLFAQGRYNVRIYKVVYETIDHEGRASIASGAVAVPYGDTLGRTPIACYAHGTTLRRTSIPSQLSGDTRIGVIMGGEGFVVAMPDLIGLGDSPVPLHPYIHAASEASAMIDAIRSSQELLEETNTEWNEQLFVFGYSQGGHAAMAAHREIQLNHKDEFTVTASAPMAGPYDVSGVQEEVIVSFDPYPTPGYLPFVLYSYNMVYDVVPDIADILKPPYDTIIPWRMDGTWGMGQINELSNPVPRLMVKDSVMDAYEADDNHPLKVALRANDLHNWVPETPVKMYYCEGDDQVAYENAIVAYDRFIAQGASPDIVSHKSVDPNLNHVDCALPTLLEGLQWFKEFKSE
ncbi:MAG: lipase family protein [Bacteroidota bacterium]